MTLEDAKKKVEDAISEHTIIVFSKTECPHSRATMRTLNEFEKNIHVIELDQIPDGPEMQAYLKIKTGQSSVPNIFIHQTHIGGNSDIQHLKAKGELRSLFL
ncbi:hypothetical protein CROQUDRAFT_653393 [Cronartium quercuum f. sp. fusiforme G11]|uniref:Glutaredoxin domain-containing protein n=1 Tax=Cronartium quercuum f. sp. fusiforme G11 TaxID=708437 RepID=A0A9P6NP22_9BASI|nr:hypothetical protein CROQUDRAFT_653393 [Cronartium quercuum f. sp. fusiforme G11]